MTPPAFMQNIRHNKVVHQHVVFLSVVTRRVPTVPRENQVELTRMDQDIYRIIVQQGFMQTPDIPAILAACRRYALEIPLTDTTYFMSRLTFLATPKPGMALWREHLFVFLARNSRRASSFFHIPSEQVIEIGEVIEI